MTSSYLTIAAFAETEPTINEYGEEEYTLSGRVLRFGANVISWGIHSILLLFFDEKRVAQTDDEDDEDFDTDNQFEIVV